MFTDISKSKVLRTLILGCATVLLLVATFTFGVVIGERKADHFSRWSDRYDRSLRPSRKSFERRRAWQFPFPSLPDTHAAFGRILSVADHELTVQQNDREEKNILVTSSTVIRIGRESGTQDDLRTDAHVAIFGGPNDQGQIEARLIRIFPSR